LPALVLLPLAKKYDVVKVHSWCLVVMATGFAGVYLFAQSALVLYLLMALMGIGWAAIVSLPFSIMSQRVDQARIGLYMGVFNLSIVLPQLVVSLGVGTFVSGVQDKGTIFLIGAVSLALASIAWQVDRLPPLRVLTEHRGPAGTALLQEHRPVTGRMSALEHLAKHEIRVGFRAVGASGVLVIHPAERDDFAAGVIAEEQPVLLEEHSAAPMRVSCSQRAALPEFCGPGVPWNHLEHEFRDGGEPLRRVLSNVP
jgi:MFS family permease